MKENKEGLLHTDYKTTLTYLIVVIGFIYSIYVNNIELVSVIIIPMIIMWILLKTNSKEVVESLVEILKERGRIK